MDIIARAQVEKKNGEIVMKSDGKPKTIDDYVIYLDRRQLENQLKSLSSDFDYRYNSLKDEKTFIALIEKIAGLSKDDYGIACINYRSPNPSSCTVLGYKNSGINELNSVLQKFGIKISIKGYISQD